ncbi:MAG: transglycosylase, partial [Deltaproteobacteria bacterium]|nr:transglycosylase [Deltaproteobacteria bacterium]
MDPRSRLLGTRAALLLLALVLHACAAGVTPAPASAPAPAPPPAMAPPP